MEALTTAVSTAIGTIQTDALTMISSVVPAALAVAGTLIVVKLGMKAFRSIAR